MKYTKRRLNDFNAQGLGARGRANLLDDGDRAVVGRHRRLALVVVHRRRVLRGRSIHMVVQPDHPGT
jgi:hypothetical protein